MNQVKYKEYQLWKKKGMKVDAELGTQLWEAQEKSAGGEAMTSGYLGKENSRQRRQGQGPESWAHLVWLGYSKKARVADDSERQGE